MSIKFSKYSTILSKFTRHEKIPSLIKKVGNRTVLNRHLVTMFLNISRKHEQNLLALNIFKKKEKTKITKLNAGWGFIILHSRFAENIAVLHVLKFKIHI